MKRYFYAENFNTLVYTDDYLEGKCTYDNKNDNHCLDCAGIIFSGKCTNSDSIEKGSYFTIDDLNNGKGWCKIYFKEINELEAFKIINNIEEE